MPLPRRDAHRSDNADQLPLSAANGGGFPSRPNKSDGARGCSPKEDPSSEVEAKHPQGAYHSKLEYEYHGKPRPAISVGAGLGLVAKIGVPLRLKKRNEIYKAKPNGNKPRQRYVDKSRRRIGQHASTQRKSVSESPPEPGYLAAGHIETAPFGFDVPPDIQQRRVDSDCGRFIAMKYRDQSNRDQYGKERSHSRCATPPPLSPIPGTTQYPHRNKNGKAKEDKGLMRQNRGYGDDIDQRVSCDTGQFAPVNVQTQDQSQQPERILPNDITVVHRHSQQDRRRDHDCMEPAVRFPQKECYETQEYCVTRRHRQRIGWKMKPQREPQDSLAGESPPHKAAGVVDQPFSDMP